jgi:hypothetical protein
VERVAVDGSLNEAIQSLPSGGTLSLEPGVHRGAIWIKQDSATITGASPDRSAVVDCLDEKAAGRACLTDTATGGGLITVRNLSVINGFADPRYPTTGMGTVRFSGADTDVLIENVDVSHCSNGFQGAVRSWTLRGVRVTDCGNMADGRSHGIYAVSRPDPDPITCERLVIENSYFDTSAATDGETASSATAPLFGTPGNGHQVKTGCRETVIRNSTLIDSAAAANSGDAINAYNGGSVILENVKIVQRKGAMQPSILSTGNPCRWGPGKWVFRNVEIVDETGAGMVRWLCGRPDIVFEGDNKIPDYLALR